MTEKLLILQRQVHQGQPHFAPTARSPAEPLPKSNAQYQQSPGKEKISERAEDSPS
jgi:hypothetical protein